jgi:hypothetical protein
MAKQLVEGFDAMLIVMLEALQFGGGPSKRALDVATFENHPLWSASKKVVR